ncbi:hypothetical protein KXJ69_06180 [Aureisphaera sp. CAU 1614]|uniref:Uncharacterized protein n=1 Tax=Halomarinibacterium sedimenti TaxID=2857106 RepID=A0A9X1FNH7_9FLAO|nr:hypothetical protein [Halomarinibacterium sedimenti]MBW2937686.1 hypothetical protein [Halomarinibacterium sedimenti]
MKNKRLIFILITATILLLIPLVAMQFSEEVNWTLADFLVAGVLLYGTGLLCELILRKVKKVKLRVALCIAIIIVLLLIWAEMAVGIFGSPIAGS